MSRFRKTERRQVPGLNTASLPDLIFTILFFFMIVTHIRPVPILTQFELPTATELQQLEEKSLLIYIMVGNENNSPIIQLNNDFVTLEEMPFFLDKIRENTMPEERNKLTVVMKIDKNTPMGLVNELKQILRKADILTIHYSAHKNNS